MYLQRMLTFLLDCQIVHFFYIQGYFAQGKDHREEVYETFVLVLSLAKPKNCFMFKFKYVDIMHNNTDLNNQKPLLLGIFQIAGSKIVVILYYTSYCTALQSIISFLSVSVLLQF